MAISEASVDAHIAHWQATLQSSYYPHRRHWPELLFHHAPLENAVSILRQGELRSRNDPLNQRLRDVAAPGVIDAQDHAHDFVRMYFRPKTPTQFYIEGVRRDADCTKYGTDTHAPVLVMLALDARTVLTRPDVQFSDRNMQLGTAQPGIDQCYFDAIPFAKVYSEGGTEGDRSITDARCAEVMTSSPLDLLTCLRGIYFRSEPERDTLLHLLGVDRLRWSNFCQVSDALKVFEKRFAFVKEIGLTPEGVVFAFNARHDRHPLNVKIDVYDQNGVHHIDFQNREMAAVPPTASRWIYQRQLPPGNYAVEVRLEGHLAHSSLISLEDALF